MEDVDEPSVQSSVYTEDAGGGTSTGQLPSAVEPTPVAAKPTQVAANPALEISTHHIISNLLNNSLRLI